MRLNGMKSRKETLSPKLPKNADAIQIQLAYYGDASLYPQIFEANRDVLKDPNLITIGQKLRIP